MPAGSLVGQAHSDVERFLGQWSALQARAQTPFQSAGWLRSWYATLGRLPGIEPLCVVVTRGDEPIALLPMVAQRSRGLSVVSFADQGVTDYNAPLIGTLEPGEQRQLWPALRSALAGHDLLRIEKMLAAIGDRPNPLAQALPVVPCEMFGNHVQVDEDYDRWRYSLEKTVRKEFERTWRVFQREPEACFERIAEPDAALRFYAELEAQQRERMAHAGDRYVLDRPAWRTLYEDRLKRGLADGSVVLTALRARGELVAALYGISDGTRYVALRISHAGEAWKHCAPGKLLLERTMHHLHGQGLRYIDFAIGDYFHKRVFRVSHTPLVDACVALSWRALPQVLAWRARRRLKREGWLVKAVRRLRRA